MTLEKRIEKAIAENTDPFTTDADIRFFETEEWNAEKATKKTRGATVKYKLYGKINFEKKFETVKEARGFFFGYVVKTPKITGELIIH